MNPRTRLFRGLAMTALLGVGLAACEDDVILPNDPTISAAPSSIELTTGGSQQIVGSVSDGSAVAFESLNTSVATVTASGNTATVQAVGVGNATIRVSSVTRPALQTAVNVIVTAPVLPPSDTADVTIEGIFQAQTISPVDPDSVVNTIDITMGVDRGNADRLAVKVNGQEIPACTQTFTSSSAEITAEGLSIGAALTSVVCSLDTRAFVRGTGDDANRGIPTYPNGSLEILVELTKNGTVLSSAQRSGFTLANSDFMQAYVATYQGTTLRPSVIGDTGLQWFGNGDLEVLLVPVIFSAASQSSPGYPAQVFLNFDAYLAGNDVTASNSVTTLTAGGFVVRFPRTGGGSANSNGLNTGREGTRINVSSTTNGGQPGPATVYSPFTGNPTANNRVHFTELQSGTALLNSILRFDNENPQAGRLILPAHPQVNRVWARNGWVNDAVNFFTAKDGSHDAPFLNGGGSVGAAYVGTAPAGTYTGVYGSIPALPGNVVYGVGQDSTVIYASLGTDTLRLGARAANTGGTASSANLTATLTNSEWAVWARVWDRLGNVSTVQIDREDPVVSVAGTDQTGTLNRIGVDLVAPDVALLLNDTLQTWSTRYNPVNDTIWVQGIDSSLDPLVGPSGVAVTRLQNLSFSCAVATGECTDVAGVVDGSAAATTPNAPAGNGWSVTQSIGVTVTQFPRLVNNITAQAYHNFRGQIWDRAGNSSDALTSPLFIRDTTTPFPPIDSILPVVSNVNIPPVAQFNGGQLYPFSATVGDNVDVRRATAGFDFSNGGAVYRLPFANIDLTAWGTDHIVRSKLLNQDLPYIRRLSVVNADTVSADTVGRPTFARFVAFDHSNWIGGFSTQANNIVPNTWDTGGTSWFSPMQFASWHEVSAGQYRFTIGGPTGTFQTPFSRVLFYVRLDTELDFSGEPLYYLIGDSAPPSIQDGYATIYRVFRYSIPTIPQEIVESGRAFTVVAVGINTTGDALLSTDGPTRLELLGNAGD